MMDDGEEGEEEGRPARCAIFRRSEEARGFFFKRWYFSRDDSFIHACLFF